MAGNDICEVFCSNDELVKKLKPQVRDLEGIAEIFKALADDTRCKIVYALSKEELCVCDLANILDSSVQSVSYHLRLLRNLKLVRFRKEGKLAFYSLHDHHVSHLVQDALEHAEEG